MKFQFVEKHTKVSPSFLEFAERKIQKIEKYFKVEPSCQVVFRKDGSRCSLELTVNNNGIIYRAKTAGDDMHTAVDHAIAAIERQIRKNKTRLAKHLRDDSLDVAIIPDIEMIDEETDFDIIRTKKFSLKPMTREEAILQMNLLHHSFFVYRAAENGAFSVVYLRQGGGYGVIEEG